ncbi:MAG: hypothetical protein EA390_03060 [Balneolaceae bacterium]|nr:MAG: hypothetical protein EA390_03060 [Balneolaceae bacterium]
MRTSLSSAAILLLTRISLSAFVILSLQGYLNAVEAQPRATLKGWESNLRLTIKDRSNNFGGFYYDRGLFRPVTQEMSPEYDLDIFTYQFSHFDDYEWHQFDNGFRTTVGSLNTPVFAVQSEFKSSLNTSDNGMFTIMAYQQEDLRAKRGLFLLGYTHQLGQQHRVGVSHTLGQQKTDLDATFSYMFGTEETGWITAEVTLLDWANNFVSELSTERQSEFEIRHSYSRKPYLFTLRLESPQLWIFRGEAVASFQPQSRAEVSRRDFPEENFLLQDWVNYQGALLEAVFPGGTAGIIYQRTFARMQREPAAGSEYELDYGNRQVQQRAGLYLTYKWRDFGIEQWFWIERNRDQQFDENPDAYVEQDPFVRFYDRRPDMYPFDFNEVRRFNKTRLYYAPVDRSFSIFLEHNGDWRTPAFDGQSSTVRGVSYRNYYHNQIVERNERLTLGFGFQFSEHAKLTLGASLDLDGDLINGFEIERENADRAIFDGGFGRLQITW